MASKATQSIDVSERNGIEEFQRCWREYWGSLTPLERDCMFKIHMQEAVGEPIDPVAYKIVHDKLDRHNEQWRERNAAKGEPRYWYGL